MQSFGVWCKMKDKDTTEKSIEKLQINLWDLEKCKSIQSPFIDFGLHIKNINKLERIAIYIPFKVEESNIEDLSKKIADAETARLLFNDDSYDFGTSGDFKYLSYKNDKENNIKMLLLSFESEKLGVQYFNIKPTNSTGIILEFLIDKIELEKYSEFGEAYIRFRIISSEIYNMLFCKIKKKNLFLESGFTALKVVDLKVNKERNIPQSVCHTLQKELFTFATFSKIHFFIMENAQNDVQPLSSQVFKDCRMLEEGEWNQYLSTDMTPQRVVVYHSRVDGKSDYSFVAKILESTTNWRIIGAYIGIVILLGIISSFLYTYVPKFICWLGNAFLNFIGFLITNFS